MTARRIHRGRRLEDWAELAGRQVADARARLGDDEVARRLERAVSADDYDTAVRVLRVVGRELQAEPGLDLTGLDARLRGADGASEVEERAGGAGPRHETGGDGGLVTPPAAAPRPTKNEREPSLGELPAERIRPGMSPADLAKELLRLRNPIVPHPRRGKR